jgi:hypothetical protein
MVEQYEREQQERATGKKRGVCAASGMVSVSKKRHCPPNDGDRLLPEVPQPIQAMSHTDIAPAPQTGNGEYDFHPVDLRIRVDC